MLAALGGMALAPMSVAVQAQQQTIPRGTPVRVLIGVPATKQGFFHCERRARHLESSHGA